MAILDVNGPTDTKKVSEQQIKAIFQNPEFWIKCIKTRDTMFPDYQKLGHTPNAKEYRLKKQIRRIK